MTEATYPPHNQAGANPGAAPEFATAPPCQPPMPMYKPAAPEAGKAGWSLGLGLFASYAPIPVFDIIAGIIGIVLGYQAYKAGNREYAVPGLICSIVGTVVSVLSTAWIIYYITLLASAIPYW